VDAFYIIGQDDRIPTQRAASDAMIGVGWQERAFGVDGGEGIAGAGLHRIPYHKGHEVLLTKGFSAVDIS